MMKMIGVVGFWLVRTTEHIQTGEKVVRRFGPYRTNEKADHHSQFKMSKEATA
jgi:hypothetical protein